MSGSKSRMSERVESILREATVEEKAASVAGTDLWNTPGFPRLDVPGLRVTDGPNGARGPRWTGQGALCVPCGSALGATWDPALLERVGRALGEEARTKGAHVLLAPTVNLHRHPLAGRNFECYSEDPHLTARLAVGFVARRAVERRRRHRQALRRQRLRVRADDDQLRGRRTHAARAVPRAVRGGGEGSRRVGRDVGLQPAQRHVLQRARVAADDGAARRVGLRRVRRLRLVRHPQHRAAANAGLDLEMPGPPQWFGSKLVDAVDAGEVSRVDPRPDGGHGARAR